MTHMTRVNRQITDAVTQQNLMVLGSASAMATGSIYQSAAHSLAIAFENAVQAQKLASISAQAATSQGVIQLYSIGSAAAAAASVKLARPDPLKTALLLLIASKALKQC
ncbi:RebB family R body protein [Phenylobacterium sp.]|uniref:RebB family R body protein n=1 Tax=Phenylobacterium sp. TaxID=1871053 RepID=UPI003561F79A